MRDECRTPKIKYDEYHWHESDSGKCMTCLPYFSLWNEIYVVWMLVLYDSELRWNGWYMDFVGPSC